MNTECHEWQRRLIDLMNESLTRYTKDATDNGGGSADTSKLHATFVLVCHNETQNNVWCFILLLF